MSTMYGADVAQLRGLARQFDSAATRLDDDRRAVGSAIQVSAWVGPVAVHFRADWESDHSRRLHSAAEILRQAATALRNNADDQERTSAIDGSGGAPYGPPFAGGIEPRLVELARLMVPHLENALEILGKFDSYSELIAFAKDSQLGRGLPIASSAVAIYELVRDADQTWADIQSGNIARFGAAIFRTGWTAAKVIPGVGLIDTVWGLGVDSVGAVSDAVLGPGTSARAFDEFGRGVADVGNAVDEAGHRAGALVAAEIRKGAQAIAGIFQ